MSDSQEAFLIGNVRIKPKHTDILKLKADALVINIPTTQKDKKPKTGWFRQIERSGTKKKAIVQELIKHAPLQLGNVIVSGTGNLNAGYLFCAVISELSDGDSENHIITDDVVVAAARKCIKIAVALELKSIAFTPWGTTIGATEAAHVTAIMANAIFSELQANPGSLEIVYLTSKNKEHYQWFADRVSIFKLLSDQVSQIRQEIEATDIPTTQREHLIKMVKNLQTKVVVYNKTVGGNITKVGQISDSKGVAIGKESTASNSD